MLAGRTQIGRTRTGPLPTKPRGAGRVMVVDDNEDNRDLFCMVLEGAGYEVIGVADGKSALQMIEQAPPDLLVLDLMMPNLNGYQVTELMKGNPDLQFIPIIIVTAKHETQDKVKGLELGVDDYLIKPVNYPELLARVKSLLRLKQTQDALAAERNKLELLYEVSNYLNSSLDVDVILARTLEKTVEALDASTGSIMLLDDNLHVLRHLLSRRYMPAEEQEVVVDKVMNVGLDGWATAYKVGAIVEDTDADERWVNFKGDTVRAGSAISVPMMNDERVGGLITLVHPQKYHFRSEHLDLLVSIASQVMIAASNAQTHTTVLEEKKRTEAIVSNLAEALITTNLEMRITDCNPAALIMLGGLQRQQIVGQLVSAVAPAEADGLIRIIASVIEGGPRVTGVETTLPQAGNAPTLPLLVSCDTIRDATGSVVGCVAAMADITKLKEAEALRQEFVHMISHDLRSPISGIVGCLDLLSDPGIGVVNDLQKSFLDMALTSCHNLNSLIGDMLDVYKLEAGQMEIKPREIDLRQMVENAIQPMRAQAMERDLSIVNAVPAEMIIKADPTRLARVFSNLLTNALKFTDTGSITVQANAETNGVEVRVVDTGIGIPTGEEQSIFDKFYQAQNRKLGKMTGTGLGLTFCKQVIEAHGGQIWAKSNPQQGSTFSFILPRRQ
jgi:PAS domain S-box-containing protein